MSTIWNSVSWICENRLHCLKSKSKNKNSMYQKKLLQDQKERSVLFVGFLIIMGIGIMMIP